jgi:hypothetical protein
MVTKGDGHEGMETCHGGDQGPKWAAEPLVVLFPQTAFNELVFVMETQYIF